MLILASAMIFAYLLPNNIEIERYEVIPERPDDFQAFFREVRSGGYTNLCDLPEEYWKQPAFYGRSWETAQKKFYDNPNYKLWGVYGHGMMPNRVGFTFENMKEGDEFEYCSFLHNGFGVWTYQGFQLEANIYKDEVNKNEYFNIEISPEEVVLSPTFPVFEDGWTQRIKYSLEAKKEIPQGKYELRIRVKDPTEEFSRRMISEVLHLDIPSSEYFKDCMRFLDDEERCKRLIDGRQKKYVDGGRYQTAQPPLSIEIIVK